jgi:hypothetical protein
MTQYQWDVDDGATLAGESRRMTKKNGRLVSGVFLQIPLAFFGSGGSAVLSLAALA